MIQKQHCHVFTSESVSEGHPDKVADQISDAILDACLARDRNARVACETTVGPDVVVNVGEITAKGFEKIDTAAIARRVARKIGYIVPEEHFAADTFPFVTTTVSPLSFPTTISSAFSNFRPSPPLILIRASFSFSSTFFPWLA